MPVLSDAGGEARCRVGDRGGRVGIEPEGRKDGPDPELPGMLGAVGMKKLRMMLSYLAQSF